MKTEMQDNRPMMTTWERHAQTVLALILTALLLWVGTTTQQTAIAMAEVKTELSFMRTARSRDAQRLDSIESRMRSLEQEFSRMRQEVQGQ